MRALIQRCKAARVDVDGQTIGAIDCGYTILLGVTHEDTEADAQALATKIAGLRIFEDEQGKMNRCIQEVEGAAILSVSQFTLYGDCRQGRRPSFTNAARAEQANRLYETFNDCLRQQGLKVETGQFGAMMDVHLINWGPVTFWLDTQDMKVSK